MNQNEFAVKCYQMGCGLIGLAMLIPIVVIAITIIVLVLQS